MKTQTPRSSFRATRQRVEEGREAPRIDPRACVARHMRDRYGPNWRHDPKRARRVASGGRPIAYARVNVLLDQWKDLFRHDVSIRKVERLVSRAMDARNSRAHFDHRGHSYSAAVPEPRQRAPAGRSVLRPERHDA